MNTKLLLSVLLVFMSSCSTPAGSADEGIPEIVNQAEAVEPVNPQGAPTETKPPADLQVNKKDEGEVQLTPVNPKDIVAPMQAIKDLDKKIEGYHLGKDLTPDQVNENTSLKKQIIRGTFDIRELCRLSLGKHWHDITLEQQNQFVELMTTLLETKAIFSKEQLKGNQKYYNITYNKETYDDAEKKKATVSSKMNVPKEKMTLDITYKLLLTPYGWRIFDVIVDDASLLSNYKFQFDRIITKSGFAELIDRMNKKLEKISQE
ncbi:MAG: ABC transporter substrate-binding protein [Deltaproteobacteria bacterium]|nr:ABC transporter substrate-binding protein [Deltaproteobacteria bacterium]